MKTILIIVFIIVILINIKLMIDPLYIQWCLTHKAPKMLEEAKRKDEEELCKFLEDMEKLKQELLN